MRLGPCLSEPLLTLDLPPVSLGLSLMPPQAGSGVCTVSQAKDDYAEAGAEAENLLPRAWS